MKARILLIEDNPQNRYLATYLLEHAGMDVVAAENGKVGIDLAESSRADLILLDIQLPDLDGYQVAAALRQGKAVDTPIVALSSFAMSGDREKALNAGCSAYIEKPIDPDKFVDQIKALLPATASG